MVKVEVEVEAEVKVKVEGSVLRALSSGLSYLK
jgi:hypothetical protein